MAEELADFSVGEEKALGAWCCSEASLLPFLIPGRSMALFNQVVLTLGG